MAKPNTFKHPKDFRVLFVYPNLQMSALAPQAIGYLSAVLKKEGFDVDLFDSTFYRSEYVSDSNEEKMKNSNVQPYDWKDRGIQPKEANIIDDFRRKVEDYQPDLLAFSVVENTWRLAEALINAVDSDIKTIVGGVFATFAPGKVLSHPQVDFVCRGEGELPLTRLCLAMAARDDTTAIPNIWAKADGAIHKNVVGTGIDMDDLPFPDWSIFEEQSLYRPMQGRIYKTLGVETQRGCPYKCTYCNSPSNNNLYKSEGAGSFHRKKSVKRIAEELEYMVKTQNPEFIYFVVDTFLAMGDRELEEFSEMYQSFRIPFWHNTRAETVNEWRGEHLEKMNCLRMNIGVEHGNEEYRAKVLQRKVSNDKMLDAFRSVAGRSFTTVANSIIGMPGETRELVFDTIEFNRQLPKEIEASGAFIFTPYHGTPLREVAIREGYLDADSICTLGTTQGSILDMPQFSADEIQGMCRVFSFYAKMPKERWPDIEAAESFSDEGEKAFEQIHGEFLRDHRKSTVDPKDATSFDLVGGTQDWSKSEKLNPDDFTDLHG